MRKKPTVVQDFGLKDLVLSRKYEHFVHCSIDFGAFSMAWPFVAFGDSKGSVYVANCFLKDTIFRIQVPEETDQVGIHQTFLTDNHHLFVLTLVDNIYKLYECDLGKKFNQFRSDEFLDKLKDEDMIKELQNEDDEVEIFFDEPILTYSCEDVRNGDALQMFIRPESE